MNVRNEAYKLEQAKLAVSLDHWANCFLDGSLSDEFADEIAKLLSDTAESLRLNEES